MFKTIVFSILLTLFASPVFSVNQFVVDQATISHDTIFIPVGIESDRDSLITFEFVARYHPYLTFLDIDWTGSVVNSWSMKGKGVAPQFAENQVAAVYAFSIGEQLEQCPYINSGTTFVFTLIFKMDFPVDNITLQSALCQYALISHEPVFIYRTALNGFEVVNVGVVNGRVPTNVEATDVNLPIAFGLSANYPNPFNPSTTIKFTLPVQSQVKIVILNLLGQVVSILCDEERSAGEYTIVWDASNYASGIYFYKMTTPKYSKTLKMMLLK